jgi:hypothetical protein
VGDVSLDVRRLRGRWVERERDKGPPGWVKFGALGDLEVKYGYNSRWKWRDTPLKFVSPSNKSKKLRANADWLMGLPLASYGKAVKESQNTSNRSNAQRLGYSVYREGTTAYTKEQQPSHREGRSDT